MGHAGVIFHIEQADITTARRCDLVAAIGVEAACNHVDTGASVDIARRAKLSAGRVIGVIEKNVGLLPNQNLPHISRCADANRAALAGIDLVNQDAPGETAGDTKRRQIRRHVMLLDLGVNFLLAPAKRCKAGAQGLFLPGGSTAITGTECHLIAGIILGKGHITQHHRAPGDDLHLTRFLPCLKLKRAAIDQPGGPPSCDKLCAIDSRAHVNVARTCNKQPVRLQDITTCNRTGNARRSEQCHAVTTIGGHHRNSRHSNRFKPEIHEFINPGPNAMLILCNGLDQNPIGNARSDVIFLAKRICPAPLRIDISGGALLAYVDGHTAPRCDMPRKCDALCAITISESKRIIPGYIGKAE